VCLFGLLRVCVRVSRVIFKVGGAQFAQTSCVSKSAVGNHHRKDRAARKMRMASGPPG